MMDDIFKEPVPPEMNEQAYEAIAEELKVAQVSVWYKRWKHVNNFIIKQVWAWGSSPCRIYFDVHGKLKHVMNT